MWQSQGYSSNRGLTGFQVKMIAVIAMTFDHVGAVMFPQYMWMRVIGRITMPVMCYFIAEGYYHTRCKRKYLSRLLMFAVLSEIPFQLCFGRHYGVAGNVFWTLMLGMMSLWIFNAACQKLKKWGAFLGVSAMVLLCVISCHFPMVFISWHDNGFVISRFGLTNTDYSWLGITAVFLVGFFHPRNKLIASEKLSVSDPVKLSYKSCDLISKLVVQLPLTGAIYIESMSYMPMSLAFGPMLGSAVLLLYNGSRGTSASWAKYWFYFYYPLHLLLIGVTA